VGDRWYDSNNGVEIVWTYDGDSYQWVEIAASGYLGQTGYTGSSGPASPLSQNLNTSTFSITNGSNLIISGSNGAVYGTSISDSIGDVRIIPQNSQVAGYTLLLSDNGKHISITTGGVTVPASVFSAGQTVVIYNNSGSSQTITATAVTMYQSGTSNTGNRTLAQRGLCTILCYAANSFVISGSVT
jgi:hypothetical protein